MGGDQSKINEFDKALQKDGTEGYCKAVWNYMVRPGDFDDLKDFEFGFEGLAFEGGGVKGGAYTGALKALEEVGILKNIKRVAGTSAGSFIALQVAIGMTVDEMLIENAIPSVDRFADSGSLSFVFNLFKSYGWHSGGTIKATVEELLGKKSLRKDITFRELYDKTGRELCVVVVSLNNRQVIYCHPKTTPNIQVAAAVRTSMALPLLYMPEMRIMNDMNHYFVDGGLLENYPLRVFDGWYLSMKPEDCFFEKIAENPKHRFDGLNNKTLGMVVFSHDEEQACMDEFLDRLGDKVIEGRPKTILSRERHKTVKNPNRNVCQKAVDEAAKNVIIALAEECQKKGHERCEHDADGYGLVTVEEFKAATSKLKKDPNIVKYLITIFGETDGLDALESLFEKVDKNGDQRLSMVECLEFLREAGVHLRYNMESRHPTEVTSLTGYLTSMLGVMQSYISESQRKGEDHCRTIGIYTDYITTADFDMETEDKIYLLYQGYKAALAYLRVRQKQMTESK